MLHGNGNGTRSSTWTKLKVWYHVEAFTLARDRDRDQYQLFPIVQVPLHTPVFAPFLYSVNRPLRRDIGHLPLRRGLCTIVHTQWDCTMLLLFQVLHAFGAKVNYFLWLMPFLLKELSRVGVKLIIIISNDTSFGCPIIYTDTNYYAFCPWIPQPNWEAIFGDNFQ